MARPKKEETIKTGLVGEFAGFTDAPIPEIPHITPLTQEFNHISEMNILRDKINEIITKL